MSRNIASLFGLGVLDEVLISSVERSQDWITTEINNQGTPGSFMTLGTEVTVGSGVVGDFSKTLATQTAVSAGAIAIQGTDSTALGAAVLAATALLASQGTATILLGTETLSGAGVIAVTATLTKTLQGVGLVSSGTLAIAGALAKTLGALTLSAQGGTLLPRTGDLNVVLDGMVLRITAKRVSMYEEISLGGTEVAVVQDYSILPQGGSKGVQVVPMNSLPSHRNSHNPLVKVS
jgi:hypothetical protein